MTKNMIKTLFIAIIRFLKTDIKMPQTIGFINKNLDLRHMTNNKSKRFESLRLRCEKAGRIFILSAFDKTVLTILPYELHLQMHFHLLLLRHG